MIQTKNKYAEPLLVLLLLLITFLPWLGLTPFNTKGEPREAIVAVSMLQSGNWILPVSFGADIPYKPPFLAWCIALFSLPAGEVTEFTSRLPSALAAVAMCLTIYCFVRRSKSVQYTAALTALVAASNIEVWRAGMNCRVDMLLTAFITGAIVALWHYRERGYRGIPWVAAACMTCAVLTKGPVGMVLPCLVAGVYGLLRGDRFFPLFLRLVSVGVSALIIPALWYYAAWLQGGSEFFDLAMEENFGRMTGTMSYGSHVKPVWYNFVTVILGMLPYTIVALLALAALRGADFSRFFGSWRGWLRKLREADPVKVMAAVAIVVVFVFYCIPKSKRSVYLLPIYPFVCYFVVLLMRWLSGRSPWLLKAWSWIVAIVVTAAAVLVGVMLMGVEPSWLPIKSEAMPCGWFDWVMALVVILAGVNLWWSLWMRRAYWCAGATVVTMMLALWMVSATVLPAALAPKSDRPVAEEVARLAPEGPVYSFVDDDMLRHYTVNYYLGDRMRVYAKDLPLEGVMLTGEKDMEEWERIYGDTYVTRLIRRFDHKSCDVGQPLLLVGFDVKPELLR